MHTYFMRAAALLKQGQRSISTDNNLGDQPHNLQLSTRTVNSSTAHRHLK